MSTIVPHFRWPPFTRLKRTTIPVPTSQRLKKQRKYRWLLFYLLELASTINVSEHQACHHSSSTLSFPQQPRDPRKLEPECRHNATSQGKRATRRIPRDPIEELKQLPPSKPEQASQTPLPQPSATGPRSSTPDAHSSSPPHLPCTHHSQTTESSNPPP